MRALKIAATGMSAQQMRVETISNNLANMSTNGYNARRAEFADLHYQQMTRAGTINASDGTVLPTGILQSMAKGFLRSRSLLANPPTHVTAR
jgi:flagellar basal-body rod protein FlgG